MTNRTWYNGLSKKKSIEIAKALWIKEPTPQQVLNWLKRTHKEKI